jgi:diacylglycerol O-acyltransferase
VPALPQLLTPIDHAWLRSETPDNLMVVGSICFFDEPVSFPDVVAAFEKRLLVHPRFTQRVDSRLPNLPRWVDAEDWDPTAHIHRIALPAPGGDAELRNLVSDLMSQPLDLTRPLWDTHLVEGYGPGSALVTRIHHTVGDGTALVRVLLGLTAPDAATSLRAARDRGPLLGARQPLPSPSVSPQGAVDLLREAGIHLLTLARVSALSPDASTPLRGPLRRRKNVAWTDPYPLDSLRSLRQATGATVNDVLLTAVTGALRRHLLRRHAEVPPSIRAVVPVDLRRVGDDHLGNQFGMVFLELPVGVAERMERLQTIHERMLTQRQSALPAVTMEVLGAAGLAPRAVEQLLLRFFGSKATAVVTNVRGPAEERFLAGRRLRRLTFFVPQSAKLGLGISLFSYAGQLEVGIIADSGLLPDPTAVTREVISELRLLAKAGSGRAVA